MNDNATNTEMLIQYLDGELEGDRLIRVEKDIAANAALQDELKNLRITRHAIRGYGLRRQVGSIHREMMSERSAALIQPRPGYRRLIRMGLRVAAAFILVLGITAIYQYARLTPGNLYQDSFRPYVITGTRGLDQGSALLTAYKNGRIKETETLFKQLARPSAEECFLAGNAFLQDDNAAGAIIAFHLLKKENEAGQTHFFEEDAEYYLAMSYLKNGQTGLARPLFEKIYEDPSHLYHDKINAWFLRRLRWLPAGN